MPASRVTLKKRIGLDLVFCWFFIGGIAHFARPAWFVEIVPPYDTRGRCSWYWSGGGPGNCSGRSA